MQTLTEKTHRLAPPGGLFDDSVVRNLFPDASEGAKKLLVHRALKHGEVLRLKPGHYCLAPEYCESNAHPFVVAAVLHSPSHVSLESSLAHHGLIPEAVFTVSSVTSMRSRVFDTPLGRFSFQRVPFTSPRTGVEAIEVARGSWAFVATPPRALADLIYLRKNVRWESDGLAFLIESMRIEEEDLSEIITESFEEVLAGLRNKRVRTYLSELKKVSGQ